MGQITQTIPKDPNPDNTLKDVLDDVIARNALGRMLIRRDVRATEVRLTYQTPD